MPMGASTVSYSLILIFVLYALSFMYIIYFCIICTCILTPLLYFMHMYICSVVLYVFVLYHLQIVYNVSFYMDMISNMRQ